MCKFDLRFIAHVASKSIRFAAMLALCITGWICSSAQTSWRGVTSTNWSTSTNWTNGVPSATLEAIIGDASFTGPYQPSLTTTSYCKSLTVGGQVEATLSVVKTCTVSGNVTINSNGTIAQTSVTLTVTGNWTNAGAYSATMTSTTTPTVKLTGTTQSVNGPVVTPFYKLTTASTTFVTLNNNISVSSNLTVAGTFLPTETATPYTVSGAGSLTVSSTGTLKVNASTFAGNYANTGTVSLSAGSTVEYSATTVAQTVRNNLTYSTLTMSGGTTKTLAGSLNTMTSSTAARGNINLLAGTLDMVTFTANRGTSIAGGTLTIANGATLRIGGVTSSFFPANFATYALALNSTVEYYAGGTQIVAAHTYGNLLFSSSTGAAVKTLPAAAFTVAGNFTSTVGAGTSVSYTAAAAISFSGTVTIGASTTFTGGSVAINIAGNWVNNGTYTGASSTVSMNASGGSLSGSGVNNFYNLTFAASANTAAAATSISVSGDLTSTGAGAFTHASGGTFTLTGVSKSITGTGFVFDNLSVTGTISTASVFTVGGNLAVAGTLSATGGTITMSGGSKTISGAGTINFSLFSVSGSISAASNFGISASLDISGSFTATAGTATFTGTSTLNGIANLFNVTLNGTSLQLSTNSVLGVAGVYLLTAGTLDVTGSAPNTVRYNGSGAQNIPGGTYNNLVITNGNTKTATAGIAVNGNCTIDAGTTFDASSFTHTILGNWVNNGLFTRGSSTIVFSGSGDATISGSNTFNLLAISKSVASNQVIMQNAVSVATVNLTGGILNTGSNLLTITTTRTGEGYIWGNIQRSHAFTAGVAYEFESPNNTITFAEVSGVTSVTVSVAIGSVTDFPFGGSISRLYTVAIPVGTYNATFRMHYEDAELNGNNEASVQTWNYSGTTWQPAGKTANSTTDNWVEQSGLTSLDGRWTLSDDANLVIWNGSVSSDWSNADNWTVLQGNPSRPPSVNDIVQIGTASFVNQPVISTAAVAKSIVLGSAGAVTLALMAGGSLSVQGNINGSWSATATHNLNVNGQTLNVNGDLLLSDGTAGDAINLSAVSGTVNIGGSLTQSGGATVSFSGASILNLSGSYFYTSGTFAAGTGTVVYNGPGSQTVAGIAYNNLGISKAGGVAAVSTALTVSGNLAVTAGEFDLNAATTVGGNLAVSSGASLVAGSINLIVAGNWSNSGTFSPSSSTVTFNGSAAQAISASTFYNMTVAKPADIAILTGNATINGNLSVTAGTLNLQTFTAGRSSAGGTFTLAAGMNLTVTGAANFPASYSTYILAPTSTVTYNGTGAQSVAGVAYGNLVLSNGGTNAKTLASSTMVNGDLSIGTGVNFNGGAYTVQLYGNWNNSGTFAAGTGTVLFYGTGKTITGNTSFYRVAVYGSYAVNGSDLTFDNTIRILTGASFNVGSGNATVNGDLTNNGSLISSGVTTFTGTRVQNISFYNALVSNSSGVINFNGTVSPLLNSTSAPTYATLNINNTGGVTASVGWNVFVAMNISSGATFNGGTATHNIYGSFSNNGTVTSNGTLNFLPTAAQTITLAGTAFSSTGMVVFGGSGALAVSGGATAVLNEVTISNTTGVTPTTKWTIGDDFSIASNAIFNAGTYTYLVGGDLESSGTLNGGTSTFTMSSVAGTVDGTATTTFYDFIVTGDITANSDFNVAHNFTNNNLFTANPGTVVFTGTGISTLGGSASPYALAQFDIRKSGSGSVLLSKNVTNIVEANVYTGTLDASTFTLAGDAAGALLHVDDSALLRIGGTSTLFTFTNYAIDTFSTVEYYGTTQSIAAVTPYGNLTLSTGGTKTAAAALTIFNNFSLSAATFAGGSFTHYVGGNWRMTSGLFTSTGTTITFNGAKAQDINSTGSFNNLTFNKTGGQTTMSSNITLTAALTFLSGKITTATYTLIMTSATGTVTGASATTGWVNGNLRKSIPTGSSVSRTFEVGDTSYSAVSVTLATVSTAGTLTAKVNTGDHPLIAGSGVAAGNTVNKYWTLANVSTIYNSATCTFNWNAADVDNGAVRANFKVGRYSSGWTQPATASPMATSIQTTGLPDLNGDFIVGELQQIIVWTGNSSTDWNTAANWSTSVVPTSTGRVNIPSNVSRFPVLSSGTGATSDLIIQSGASLTVNNATMRLIGAITNNGTFNTTNATIEFAGNVAQTIPANTFSANSLYNLTINNLSGVVLAGGLALTNTLTISTGSLNTGGFLTLRSTATSTARVAAITSTASTPVSGNVTVERYISGRRKYRLMTSSVTTSASSTLAAGQESLSIWGNWQNKGNNTTANVGTIITGGTTADGFDLQTNYPSLYTYDAVGKQYIGFSTANARRTKYTPLQAGVAYFMFIYGDRTNNIYTGTPSNTVLSALGTLTTGDQVYTTSSAIPLSGVTGRYTLLGNPFASPVDWALLPRTNLENTYWGWDPNLNTSGGYVTVSTTGTVTLISPYSGTTGLNQFIQPGQGFFVRTAGASPTLSIREQDKSATGNNNAFRVNSERSSAQMPLLAVNLLFDDAGTATLADGALVAFDPAFSNEIGPEDAAKLPGGAEGLSIKKGSELLSIDARQMPRQPDTLLLQLSGLGKPRYTLQVFAQEMGAAEWQPLLSDLYLHTALPLSLQDTNYIAFDVNLSDSASFRPDRFSIRFVPQKVLAVSFISCKALLHDDQVELSWTVTGASGVQKWVIERSQNGLDFIQAGEMGSSGGDETHSYMWQQKGVGNGTWYYRIRSVEKDGSVRYSRIVAVSRETGGAGVRVSPNPVRNGEIRLLLTNLPKDRYRTVVYDASGRQVISRMLDHPGGSADQVVPANGVAPGTYRLELTAKDFRRSETIIIQ